MSRSSLPLAVAVSIACTIPLAAQTSPPIASLRIATGLARPVFCTAPAGDVRRLFVVERTTARIRLLKDGVLLPTPFLDLDPLVVNSTGEQGLLGLAFHPNYAGNGRCFVYYIDNASNVVVAEYRVSSNPDLADPQSGSILLTVPQPSPSNNGGMLAFSPRDGYLYVGIGDGGPENDPQNRAQDLTQLRGKILRIDVDTQSPGLPYGIPATNPFTGANPGRDEIWAYGLRNPWRFGFDRATGDLYIGDVGAASREEVDWIPGGSAGGQNFGWRCMEGELCTGLTGCTCNAASLTAPLRVYNHGGFRCAIIGGYVYRGCAIPGLQGYYFHADHCSGQIFTCRAQNGTMTQCADRTFEMLPPAGQNIAAMTSFGEDALGELYICCLNSGDLYKVVPGIGLVTPSLSLGGIPAVGTTVPITITSPGDGGRPFVAAFSAAVSPPIVLPDGRLIALAPDALFGLSTSGPNPLLGNTLGGSLNAGASAVVTVTIPNLPVLVGATIYAAFAVGNPQASLGIGAISCPLPITFQ